MVLVCILFSQSQHLNIHSVKMQQFEVMCNSHSKEPKEEHQFLICLETKCQESKNHIQKTKYVYRVNKENRKQQ